MSKLKMDELDRQELEDELSFYQNLVVDMREDYEELINKLTPELIQKKWVKNVGKKCTIALFCSKKIFSAIC